MADALKTFFSTALVKRLAQTIERVFPAFPSRSFVRRASEGLAELELLDRGKHISAALAASLPRSYPEAIEILLRSLGPRHATEELVGAGMAPFFYLPHVLFVAEHGLDHFEVSLRAQYELTQRFTAESSIRPYIARDPERTWRTLRSWAKDADAHVRRLVSEGTRLRLPWAARVAWLDSNPERVIELLELLKDDPTTLVRRSVANNLNDLAKVHPELAVAVCRRWSATPSPERRWLVKHALRSLVKRGHPGALQTLGVGAVPQVMVTLTELAPRSVKLGGRLRFRFELASTAAATQELLIDYAVHFVKANGSARPKVFKLRRLQLAPASNVELGGLVSFESLTTRRPYPGRHHIDVLVNGVAHPLAEFQVRA
jgi:3-methyladenine DNA glycosylase AlkC